jgi:hypothetical protein
MKTSPDGLNSKTAKNLSQATLRNLNFKIHDYKVHQVGPKDSGSQNFSFLALKAEPVAEVQILRSATATARDRRKKFIAQIMFFSYKKS